MDILRTHTWNKVAKYALCIQHSHMYADKHGRIHITQKWQYLHQQRERAKTIGVITAK